MYRESQVSYAVLETGRPVERRIIPAETIVLNCLRSLQAIPDADRLHADILMDQIARLYMTSSPDITTERRRGFALLRIAAEVAE